MNCDARLKKWPLGLGRYCWYDNSGFGLIFHFDGGSSNQASSNFSAQEGLLDGGVRLL